MHLNSNLDTSQINSDKYYVVFVLILDPRIHQILEENGFPDQWRWALGELGMEYPLGIYHDEQQANRVIKWLKKCEIYQRAFLSVMVRSMTYLEIMNLPNVQAAFIKMDTFYPESLVEPEFSPLEFDQVKNFLLPRSSIILVQ